MSRLPGDFFFTKIFFFSYRLCIFLVNALCKFGHQKLPIKISRKLLQLVASDLISLRRMVKRLPCEQGDGQDIGWGHSV